MKKILFSTIALVVIGLAFSVNAGNPSYRQNRLRQQAKENRIREEINKIPIYREKLEGNYKILGPVHGEDLFTNNKSSIFWLVREQAYNAKADAIMEFSCRRMVKSVFQQCAGFAIRYLKEGEKEGVKTLMDIKKEKEEAKKAKKEAKEREKEEKKKSVP